MAIGLTVDQPANGTMVPPQEPAVAAPGQAEPSRRKPPKLSKEDIELWMKRLKAARKVRQKYLDKAKSFRDEYYSKHYPHGQDAKGRPLNLIASWLDVVWPQLLNAMPQPVVTPERGEEQYEQSARLQAGYIRKMMRLMGADEQIQYAGFDAWWCIGWIKYGWSTVMAREEPAEARTGENSAGGHADYDFHIEEDAPFLRYCRDDEILVDPRTTQPSKERWICHELYLTIRELAEARDGRGDPLYDRQAVKSLEARAESGRRESTRNKDTDDAALTDLNDDPMYQTVEVYEIHYGDQILVLAKDCDRALRHDYKELQIEGYPFLPLRFRPDGRHYYPPSCFAPWFDLYIMVNEFLAKTVEAASMAKEILLYDLAAVDQDEVNRLATAANGSLIGVRNLAKYMQAKLGGVPQDYAQVFAVCERLADKISRVSDQTRGMKASAKMTATEVQTIQAAADKAIAGMFGEFTRFMGRIYRAVGQMGFIYQQGEIPVNIGRYGRRNFALFSRDALLGEVHDYNYAVESTGTDAVNPVVKQKRLGEALSLAANPQLQQMLYMRGIDLDLGALTERYLDALGIENIDAIVRPLQGGASQGPGNAEEQAMRAALENRLLLLGQWVQTQMDDDHAVHLQVHQMGPQSEAAAAHMQEHMQFYQVEQAALMQGMGQGPQAMSGPAEGQLALPAPGAPQHQTAATQEPYQEARR